MDPREFTLSPTIRQHKEESWRLRLKLEETLRRYRTAAQYRKMVQGQGSAASDTLMRARQGESQALDEYNRALRVFTDLTVHGRPAEGEAIAAPAGAGGLC